MKVPVCVLLHGRGFGNVHSHNGQGLVVVYTPCRRWRCWEEWYSQVKISWLRDMIRLAPIQQVIMALDATIDYFGSRMMPDDSPRRDNL